MPSNNKNSVQFLDKNTARLITSNQVIQGPYNAVKELVENALDAKASSIDIRLDNYGLDKIEVRDNGTGITKDNVERMCLHGHSSKIKEFSDLGSLSTYGFRGEALAALCCVANVSITTKSQQDPLAHTYKLDSEGNIVETKPSHLGQGTTVTVSQLFFHQPARRRILLSGKGGALVGTSKAATLSQIRAMLGSLGVAWPDLRISLVHNGSLVWRKNPVTPSNPTPLRTAFGETLGHALASNFELLTSTDESLGTINLLMPKKNCKIKEICQSTKSGMITIVNKRAIHHKNIEKMILDYLRANFTELTKGKYPCCVVELKMDPQDIDVNLEPDKSKILINADKEATLIATINNLLSTFYGTNCSEIDRSDVIPSKLTQSERKNGTSGSETEVNGSRNSKDVGDEILENANASVEPCKKKPKLDSPTITSTTIPGFTIEILGAPSIEENGHHGEYLRMANRFVPVPEALSSNFITPVDTPGVQQSIEVKNGNQEFITFDGNKNEKLFEETNSDASTHLAVQAASSDHVRHTSNFPQTASSSDISSEPLVSNKGSPKITSPPEMSPFRNPQVTTTKDPESTTSQCTSSSCSSLSIAHQISDLENSLEVTLTEEDHEALTELEKLYQEPENEIRENPLGNEPVPGPATKGFADAWSRGQLGTETGGNIEACSVMKPKQISLDMFPLSQSDSISSQMGCRELGGFSLFCREIRPQILKENPGTLFTTVAQMLATRWKNLPLVEKVRYGELSMEIKETKKLRLAQMNDNPPVRRSPLSVSKKSKPINREGEHKLVLGEPSSSNMNHLDKVVTVDKDKKAKEKQPDKSPVKKPKRSRKEVQSNFKLEDLNELMARECVKKESAFELIGPIQNCWLLRQNGTTSILRPWALRETLLYLRLLEEMSLPLTSLDSPLKITANDCGYQGWQALSSLETNYDVISNTTEISSPLITKNGFRIRVIQDETTEELASAEITHISSAIPNYGITDLTELLSKMTSHRCSLAQSRPSTIVKYIEKQAMDGSNSCDEQASSVDVRELLDIWGSLDSPVNQCFHDNEIFVILSPEKE